MRRFTIFAIVFLFTATLLLELRVERESQHQVTAKFYEDGSGHVTFEDNMYTCVIPAFDSPGDHVQCYKGGTDEQAGIASAQKVHGEG